MSSPSTDIVAELRAAAQTTQPIGMNMRFLMIDAADYIELLRRRMWKAERPWWVKLWSALS